VTQPEVFWPDVVGEVVPELSRLSAGARDDFLFQQARLWHTVRLMPGAADVLRELHHRGVLVGLASNCQPYTLRELDTELRESSLSRALFCPELCFFSFEHGFSKPDPHVFRWLAARLRGMGVTTAEALTLGDRIDNDIEPARAQGFQTWQLTSSAADGMGAGTWEQFQRKLTTD
ncbi:MAG TPA: HAD family hydrolase, partial [Verrucomicrobiae bacterium]